MPLTPEQAFGEALRAIRKKRGLSQEALAFACDLTTVYISMLERGIKSPTLRTLFALAKALEVAPSEMLREVEALKKKNS